MKNILVIAAFTLPVALFAQGRNTNINPPAQTMQQANYNNQNHLLEDPFNGINNGYNVQPNDYNQQADSAVPSQQGKGPASLFGTGNGNEVPCTDCDKVKNAIKA